MGVKKVDLQGQVRKYNNFHAKNQNEIFASKILEKQFSIEFHTGAKVLNLSENSHFKKPQFDKIHIFKISFLTKITMSKSHFSQNSHFQNMFQTSNLW